MNHCILIGNKTADFAINNVTAALVITYTDNVTVTVNGQSSITAVGASYTVTVPAGHTYTNVKYKIGDASEVTVDGNKTADFAIENVTAALTVTYTDNVTATVNGEEQLIESGEDIAVAAPEDDEIIIGLTVKDSDGTEIEVTYDEETGKYTVDADDVQGKLPITVTYTELTGTIEPLYSEDLTANLGNTYDQYKLVMIETDELTEGKTLAYDGEKMIYTTIGTGEDAKSGYVALVPVDDAADAAAIAAKISEVDGDAVTLSGKRGDVNGDGVVDIFDVMPVNAAINNVMVSYAITCEQYLKMDVNSEVYDNDTLTYEAVVGNGTINTADVLWILNEIVGNHTLDEG